MSGATLVGLSYDITVVRVLYYMIVYTLPYFPLSRSILMAIVYAWGKNNKGELSLGSHTNQSLPKPIKKAKDFAVISSGGSHSAYISGSGKLYTCGCCLHSKLGLPGISTTTIPIFTYVSQFSDKKITHVACGEYHTLSLAEDRTVHTWGGTLHYKLGTRGANKHVASAGNVASLNDCGIVYVDCGDYHSVALSEDGAVYSWGGGGQYNKGQCGLGHSESVERPTLIPFFSRKPVRTISCGGYHTLGLTTENELFA